MADKSVSPGRVQELTLQLQKGEVQDTSCQGFGALRGLFSGEIRHAWLHRAL